MRRMGIWEIVGAFIVVIPFAWYVCMDGFKRKSNKPPVEEDKGQDN
ncbi:MAG: hypothetical protein OEV28_11220 [Nitrospirota bacterium]|nr:hypothetical protein [Nitrospirota bacterium]